MEEIKTITYRTLDGKIFEDKDKATIHEKSLGNVKAYKIYAYPDLTEGKHSYQFQGYLLVNAETHHDMFVEDWCYRNYKNRIDFIMGAYGSNAIMEKWNYLECQLNVVKGDNVLDKLEDMCSPKIWG